jgi:hypothetical protein
VAFVDYFAGLSGTHDSLVAQALEAHVGLRAGYGVTGITVTVGDYGDSALIALAEPV